MKQRRPIKGVKYIAGRLRYYQPNKYPTYTDALKAARKILPKIEKAGKTVTVKNIWKHSRKHRKKNIKKRPPEIDPDLLKPSYYFELVDYPARIKRSSNKVFFHSTISRTDLPDIQGGESVDYYEYFADFVNFINGINGSEDREDSRYETDWNVMCTEPVKIKGRWVSTIIAIDEDGNRADYGFDPDAKDQGPTEPEPEPDGKRKPEKEPKVKEKKKDQAKDLELKIKQAEAKKSQEVRQMADGLNDMLKQGFITKKEYLTLYKDLLQKL